MPRLVIASLLIVLATSLQGCGEDVIVFVPDAETLSTFETNLEGWFPVDLGLAAGSSFSVVAEDGVARYEFDATAPDGEGVLVREYVLRPDVDYLVRIDLFLETSDVTGEVEPWRFVAGTSVEGAEFVLNDDITTETTNFTGTDVRRVQGDLEVTSGAAEGSGDEESEIRIAIGFRPVTSDQRSYAIDNLLVQFLPLDR